MSRFLPTACAAYVRQSEPAQSSPSPVFALPISERRTDRSPTPSQSPVSSLRPQIEQEPVPANLPNNNNIAAARGASASAPAARRHVADRRGRAHRRDAITSPDFKDLAGRRGVGVPSVSRPRFEPYGPPRMTSNGSTTRRRELHRRRMATISHSTGRQHQSQTQTQ